MSKSKYSKTKAALMFSTLVCLSVGLLCGMSRCKDYKFHQAGSAQVANVNNRQMRRMSKKK